MPPALFIEKTEVTISDRTLVSVGPARPVRWSMKTLASVSDRTLGHLVTGRWRGASSPADVAAHMESPCDRTLGVSGRARPDVFGREKLSLDAY